MPKIVTKYLVFDNDSHEYDLVVTKGQKKTTFELFHSSNEIWSAHTRNQLAMKIVNNGNGFKLPKKFRKLKYDESDYIRLILNFDIHIDTNEANKLKYKLINSETTLEL